MPRHRPTLPSSLTTSIGLRMPVFADGTSATDKLGQLESYLLLTAYTQGELSECRLEWLSSKIALQDEWAHLTGWEDLRRTRTETAVTHAKRMLRPDLYDALEDHDWMIKRLTEEVDRMERDSVKASRAYTFITGS